MAAKLVAQRSIALAIAAGTSKLLAANELTAARVLEEYRRLAFCDMRSFFDANNNLIPIAQMTAEQGSALSGLEVLIKNAQAGDGHTDTIHKFKLWDKTRALEALAKHFGLLVENLALNAKLEIVWKSSE